MTFFFFSLVFELIFLPYLTKSDDKIYTYDIRIKIERDASCPCTCSAGDVVYVIKLRQDDNDRWSVAYTFHDRFIESTEEIFCVRYDTGDTPNPPKQPEVLFGVIKSNGIGFYILNVSVAYEGGDFVSYFETNTTKDLTLSFVEDCTGIGIRFTNFEPFFDTPSTDVCTPSPTRAPIPRTTLSPSFTPTEKEGKGGKSSSSSSEDEYISYPPTYVYEPPPGRCTTEVPTFSPTETESIGGKRRLYDIDETS